MLSLWRSFGLRSHRDQSDHGPTLDDLLSQRLNGGPAHIGSRKGLGHSPIDLQAEPERTCGISIFFRLRTTSYFSFSFRPCSFSICTILFENSLSSES